MAQRIKLAVQCINLHDLARCLFCLLGDAIPDRYKIDQKTAPEEYRHLLDAQYKVLDVMKEIDKTKKMLKPEIQNRNISDKL
jgi:hypothetical protein